MTNDEIILIIWEENDNYEYFDESIIDTSRWSTYYQKVVRLLSEDTYWRLNWSRGSTEYQDNGCENVTIEQVYPIIVPTTFYLTEKELP